jgi:hypothetical protein
MLRLKRWTNKIKAVKLCTGERKNRNTEKKISNMTNPLQTKRVGFI